ncbi:Nitrogen permease regulator 2 [Cryptosporidium felis]|nr:Nitrogen permease regulator 2 [Cryptosporidium felis]
MNMKNFWTWPNIEAIILCKFDEELGPIVLSSSPPDIFGSEKSQLSSLITQYLLPDSHFEGKTISFLLDKKWRATGVPIFIEGSHYLRNSFQFTVCIVVKNEKCIFKEIYSRHVARILGYAFKLLEEDCGILYHYCTFAEDPPELIRKTNWKNLYLSTFPKNISEAIENIRSQLNQSTQVFYEFGDTNLLTFKIRPPSSFHITNPEDVPFPLKRNIISEVKYLGIDIIFTRLLPFINGINTIFEISKSCSLPIEFVKTSLEHLIFYRLIAIIDMISPENKYRYIGTDKKNDNLYEKLSIECRRTGSVATFTKKYIKELKEQRVNSIHEFIAKGVALKKIVRLHEYPIVFFEPKGLSGIERELLSLCNGNNTLDYIQISLGFETKSNVIKTINNMFVNLPIYWAYL